MFLLDTHVLVWMLAEPARLGPDARAAIESAHSEEAPCVSAISFWEVARPEGKGRIELGSSPLGWRRQLLDQGLEEIPATGAIGVSAAELRGFHGDPRPTD